MATVRYLCDVLVPVDAAGSVLRPGVLDVEGGEIRYAGTVADAPPAPEHVRRLAGLVMPGLVNCHAHSAMTLLRGVGDGLALDRWLQDEIWPREGRLGPGDSYWGTLLGCHELLRAGVTTTCEMYLHGEEVVAAALESGIRCVVTPGIFDLPGDDTPGWPELIEATAALHAAFDGKDGRLRIGIGPHSAYTLPRAGLEATRDLAAELGLLVQIHLAETRAEGDEVEARYGASAPRVLADLGLLEQSVLAAHAVWLSDEDLALLASHDVAVAHCPQSNGKLGSGLARLRELLDAGLRVGLGTDGPASNDNLDLWEELRLAPLLARLRATDPTAMGAPEALHLATRGGADALGLAAGTLEAGRVADFIRLDLDDDPFVPATADDELVGHLVWSASSRAVRDVWVGGRPVVEDGRSLTLDPLVLRREVQHRARRLAGRGEEG